MSFLNCSFGLLKSIHFTVNEERDMNMPPPLPLTDAGYSPMTYVGHLEYICSCLVFRCVFSKTLFLRYEDFSGKQTIHYEDYELESVN